MIKILVILLSIGLSTGLTLLLNLNEVWKIVVGIVGFSLTFFLFFIILFFGIVGLFALRVRSNEVPVRYSKTYRKLYNVYQFLLLSLFSVKLTVNGMDKVPNDTNFVMLQNHLSNIDPIFTDYAFRKYPLIFVSKESLFKIPFFGKIIRHIGYIKLSRKNGVDDAKELMRELRWVRSEECSLCFYPEGTRNKFYPDPLLLEFKEGAIGIAMKTGKPIIISTIHGSEDINNKLLFKIHNLQIDVLKVISPDEYNNMSADELSKIVRETMIESIKNPSNKKEKVRLY